MKVVTIFGTRPEIIRLSLVIPLLDRLSEHTLVHTGQNYDPSLSDVFFDELQVRKPDIHLGVEAAGFAEQAGQIIARSSRVLEEVRPERLLILGDTNSGLAAIAAARMRVPVYHMEAGNRCYDGRVPEEINRRIIDHCSAVLMPYTYRSKENLVREGIERDRIFVTGNPIHEVIENYTPLIDASSILSRLSIPSKEYFLVTLHRAENVDEPSRLSGFMEGLCAVAEKYRKPVIVSVHPRTADKLERHAIKPKSEQVRLLKPLGFFDFVKLEKNALCVLSDSGTVQEECCILHVANATLRDVTERPETIECGSNILTGGDPATILRIVDLVLVGGAEWDVPDEYLRQNVASVVVRVVLGYRYSR